MLTTAILGIVLGAMLSLRFNVVALIPGLLLVLVITAANSIARGEGIWATAEMMGVAAVALQLGYLLGNVASVLASPKHANSRGSGPIATGASRPT